MGVIVGLIGTGIGLAIEAASEYQSSSKSSGKRTNSNYQQDLVYGSRGGFSNESQAQQDAKAFQELQAYADFQRNLSTRVQEDIMKADKYTPVNPRILSQGQRFGDYFSHQPYMHPSLQQQSPPIRLPCPVIIPQQYPGDPSRGWVRAYAPALMKCGIDQYTFLKFLDSFNASSKSSPYFDAVDVASFCAGLAPEFTPMLISMAVAIAVRMAETTQTERKTTSFLTRANTELFIPHGLFAMVLTYRPTNTSQIDKVNTSLPTPDYATSSTTSSAQMPEGAPLIFPDANTTPPTTQQNTFRQIGHFIADYGDRRAQSKHVCFSP
ncbi:hypothetical protein D0Z07_8607 [Hyphodiscus hymeniophilus]|uniref:Uncharacterized protein n=1 Tax=Hyphodiscus hymeniophilus TaxID=353542 RepID=A0A9P6SKS9_9HELO|nr:hypothetical protein D0Z07_8607 [Hyphodiscus hymeniophilus]